MYQGKSVAVYWRGAPHTAVGNGNLPGIIYEAEPYGYLRGDQAAETESGTYLWNGRIWQGSLCPLRVCNGG